MAETVHIKPEMIRWAVSRSQLAIEDLQAAFPKLDDWQSGRAEPTMRQLERFAQKTMTPFGYLFLEHPPDERLPIPDFRTAGDRPITRPSPNLIEMIHAMQRRQAWMREFVVDNGEGRLPFVASAKTEDNVVSLAAIIRDKLGLDAGWAEVLRTWEDALRVLRSAAERIGIFVSSSAFVGLIIEAYKLQERQAWAGAALSPSAVARVPDHARAGQDPGWWMVPYPVPMNGGVTESTLAIDYWTNGMHDPPGLLWSKSSPEPTESEWKQEPKICEKWKNTKTFHDEVCPHCKKAVALADQNALWRSWSR